MSDDGGGGEMLAVDLTHQVIVNVRLPRHLLDRSLLSLSRVRIGAWGEERKMGILIKWRGEGITINSRDETD